jgi:hypothetical protein
MLRPPRGQVGTIARMIKAATNRASRIGDATSACPSSDTRGTFIEVILDARQPKELKLAGMLGNGPMAWQEQLRAFGICSP